MAKIKCYANDILWYDCILISDSYDVLVAHGKKCIAVTEIPTNLAAEI
jgi:hypothetical protein